MPNPSRFFNFFTGNNLESSQRMSKSYVKFFSLFLLLFLSSCLSGSLVETSEKEKQALLDKAIALQERTSCVELSEKKIISLEELEFYYTRYQLLYERQDLPDNFEIIEEFIAKETDLDKKLKIQDIYQKLYTDVYENRVYIDPEDVSEIFSLHFEDFPQLRDSLVKASDGHLALYTIYRNLHLSLSSNVNHFRVFSDLEKSMEQMNFYDEEVASNIQDLIVKNLPFLVKHDCLCQSRPESFIERDICLELIP